METVAPARNPVPVMVTTPPPPGGPPRGDTPPTSGASRYVKQAHEPASAVGFVTVTAIAPAAWAGVVAVIDVLLITTTFVAEVPPNVTVALETKPVPAIFTVVPPR